MPPKTSLADALGVTTNTEFGTSVDPNAYQYGGAPGGAAGREGYLTQLGAQGANYSNAVNNQYSGAQNDALGMMKDQAAGNDHGVAENQLKQGAANAAQEQFSGAASTRGGGGGIAAAQMNAANNAAAGQANANAQAAQLRSQLQNQGVQNYGAYAQGLSAQQNQANQFNAQLQQGYAGQTNDVYAQQLQAQMNQQQQQSQNALQAQQMASQQGQANATNNAGLIGSVTGAAGGVAGAIGGLFSSDENAKTNILGQSGGGAGSMPGFGRSSVGIGEAELAGAPSNALHLKGPTNIGMNAWIDQAMAKPWSPQAAAADANVNKVFFTSDTRAKKNAIREDAKNEALEEQAAQLRDAIGSHTDGFEWSDPNAPTAVSLARHGEEPARDGYPRPEEPSTNPVDRAVDTFKPATYEYDESVAPEQAAEMPGEQVGVIAQDVQHAPNGRSLVRQQPGDFKQIHIPTAVSTTMAGLGRMNERDKDNRARIDDHDARLAGLEAALSGQDDAMPAGRANLSPQLAPEDHGIYSVYDNGTKLYSDANAKKNAHDEGYAKGLVAAQGYAPNPQDVRIIKHASSNPETDEAWRAAITAPDRTVSHVDLPDPPPPPMTDPQADRMASRLAAYNAQADAGLRAAVRGDPNHDAQMQDLGFEETEPRVDTNTLKEHLNAIASRTPPKRARGGLAEAVGAR